MFRSIQWTLAALLALAAAALGAAPQDALSVQLSAASPVLQGDVDVVVKVTVTKDERVLFGEEDVTSHIDQALKDNARVQKEHELYIRADKEARYGIVATVVAAARNSGVESLNLLVQPEIEAESEAANDQKPSGSKQAH